MSKFVTSAIRQSLSCAITFIKNGYDMNDLVFKGQNDQVITTSLLVAETFKKEHRNVLKSIRKLMSATNVAVAQMFDEQMYVNDQGKEQPMFYMNRDGFTLLAMGFTGDKAIDFKVEYINAFNKMEEAIKKGLIENTQKDQDDFDDKKRFIEWSANFLGVNDAGKLMMARKLAAEYGMDKYLPDYVESKGQLHSATYLLKKYGCNFSATTFNTCAHTTGLIKKMERKGKGGITRTWWALDETGKEFGEDLVSDKCPSQTQIHWYDDKFTQVLDIISAEYVGKRE